MDKINYNSTTKRILRPLNLLEILKQNTDLDQSLDAKAIKEKLRVIYDDDVSKSDTIINYMAALMDYQEENDAGLLIYDKLDEGTSDKHEYYSEDLGLTDGELSALYLLLLKSKAIYDKHSHELLRKVTLQIKKRRLRTISDVVNHPHIDDGQLGTENYEVLTNLELITEAIHDEKNIVFDYCTYNFKKELVPKVKEFPYEVKPLIQISSDGDLYVIGYNKYDEEERVYRIDKMKNIRIDDTIEIEVKQDSTRRMSKNITFMHLDETIKVTLRCEKRILSYVIEQFEEAVIEKDDESDNHFFATIPDTSFYGAKYWILQYSSDCEVLTPPDLRESIKVTLKKALERYNK